MRLFITWFGWYLSARIRREVIALVLRGRVKNGVVVLENSAPALPEGSLVQITPLKEGAGSPDPFSEPGVNPPSKERQQALLGLIGMWKTDNPPNGEEVERIIEEYRMTKYG